MGSEMEGNGKWRKEGRGREVAGVVVVAEEGWVSGGGGWEKGWGTSLRRLIKMQLTFFFKEQTV